MYLTWFRLGPKLNNSIKNKVKTIWIYIFSEQSFNFVCKMNGKLRNKNNVDFRLAMTLWPYLVGLTPVIRCVIISPLLEWSKGNVFEYHLRK